MLVAPSLLAADFGNLEREMLWFNQSQADQLHLDVMDGVFVPNISFGFPVMERVAQLCDKPLDVHLMIVEPTKFIPQVAALGAHYMNVHYEALAPSWLPALGVGAAEGAGDGEENGDAEVVINALEQIRKAGMHPAITLCPDTPVSVLRPILSHVDMVLLMSVHPGFGGQKFIPATLERIVELRQLMDRVGSHPLIEVDGGVNHTTAPQLAEAGADVLVAGSYVFRLPDPQAIVAELKAL